MKQYIGIITGFLLGCFLVWCFRSCDKADKGGAQMSAGDSTAYFKEKNSQLTIERELGELREYEYRRQYLKSDSIAKFLVKNYRGFKTVARSLPCDSALNTVITLCDTIIVRDSISLAKSDSAYKECYIRNLKADTMLFNKNKIIKSDSLEKISLRKQVKKEKNRKRLAIALASAIAVVVALK